MPRLEDSPILPATNPQPTPDDAPRKTRRATALLTLIALIGGCIFIAIRGEKPFLPKDPLARAHYFLSSSPVIDGHIDVPELARTVFGNDLDSFDLRKKTVSGTRGASSSASALY
jgi:membrane dipeptidase